MKRPTIRDVARRAGVSVATASRALAGSDAVRPQTTERIREVARTLRYVPHSGARSLATNRTSTIGVLLPDIHGEFFSELIRGLDRASRTSGYHLLVSGFHNEKSEIEAVLRATRGRVDGLVLMMPDVEPVTLRPGLLEGQPVVLLNCRLEGDPYESLEIDGFGGAMAVVRHFASLGHRRIAILGGPEGNHDARERRRGYRAAMHELGLPWSEILELPGDFTEAAGQRAATQLLTFRDRPTAVFAANDDMAIGLLSGLRAAGVEVPGEIAIAGFDDIPTARWVSPALTSVRVEIADLGAQAMERLLAAIHDGDDHRRHHGTLPAHLVVRESSGATALRDEPPRGTAARSTATSTRASRGGRRDEQER